MTKKLNMSRTLVMIYLKWQIVMIDLNGTISLGLKFYASKNSKDIMKSFNSNNYLSGRDKI